LNMRCHKRIHMLELYQTTHTTGYTLPRALPRGKTRRLRGNSSGRALRNGRLSLPFWFGRHTTVCPGARRAYAARRRASLLCSAPGILLPGLSRLPSFYLRTRYARCPARKLSASPTFPRSGQQDVIPTSNSARTTSFAVLLFSRAAANKTPRTAATGGADKHGPRAFSFVIRPLAPPPGHHTAHAARGRATTHGPLASQEEGDRVFPLYCIAGHYYTGTSMVVTHRFHPPPTPTPCSTPHTRPSPPRHLCIARDRGGRRASAWRVVCVLLTSRAAQQHAATPTSTPYATHTAAMHR